MITIENKQELYGLLHKYLNLLVNTKFFSSQRKHHKSISNTISEYFSILYWLAKDQEDKLQEVSGLVQAFKDNYGYTQEISEDVDYSNKNYSDLKDEINFIKVCVQNIFKTDLDTVNIEELKQKEEVAAKEYKTQLSSAAEAVFHNTTEVLSQDENPLDSSFLNNLVLKNSALNRLNQDIEEGVIYIYKSKPKRNVFIKQLIIYVFMSLAIICSILTLKGRSTNDLIKDIPYVAISVFYLGLIVYKIHTSFKNDNHKYSFQKNTLFHLILSTVIFWFCFPHGSSDHATHLWSLSNLFVKGVIASVVIATTIYLIGILWLQPEKDQGVIDKTLEKHMSVLSKDAS